jgi:DNA-binding NtrC family response regulator
VALIAPSETRVFITGESGTGKEVVADVIHGWSARASGKIVKVNCAAIPENLLESELFGHERGAFTGATAQRIGRFEEADGGTIFLDEIAEMPRSLQSTLMQVLSDGRFNRARTSDLIEADVRVVAASSENVERISSGSLISQELYDRLCTYTIQVPPLRDRKEELSLLSRHLMHRFSRHYGLPPREFSPAMIETWRAYNWPGNLRELEQCVKRYLLAGDEESAIGMRQSLPQDEAQRDGLAPLRSVKHIAPLPSQPQAGIPGSKSLRSLVNTVKAEAEKNAIALALEKTGWNRKAAARLLDVSYRTVLYKIEEYRLSASDSPV